MSVSRRRESVPKTVADSGGDGCYEGCPCSGEHLDKLVQPALLALLEEEDLHGYLLVQRLAEMSLFHGRPPDPSGVYRYLKQMEKRGLVTSTWDASATGPAKRLYRLTEAGRGCLSQWLATLRGYDEAIRDFLALVESASPRAGAPMATTPCPREEAV